MYVVFFCQFGGSIDGRSFQDGHFCCAAVTDMTYNLWGLFQKVERHGGSCGSLLSCIYCLQFVLLWCVALKSIWETHFSLFLYIHLTLVYVSWDFMCWDEHTTTQHAEKHTHMNGKTHIYTYTQIYTPSMQCSKYNDCILAPFSPGWWQVFFPLTWLK